MNHKQSHEITLKIGGMHCTSCAMNIDFELEDLEGVLDSHTNYVRMITIVRIHPDKTTHTDIINVITALGYTAELIQ